MMRAGTLTAAALIAVAAGCSDAPTAGPRAFPLAPSESRAPFAVRRVVDLGTLGGVTSFAEDVNDRGHVVGSSATPAGETHAFFWRQGQGMVDLGTLGGNQSGATDVNNSDQVVGWSRTAAVRGKKRRSSGLPAAG